MSAPVKHSATRVSSTFFTCCGSALAKDLLMCQAHFGMALSALAKRSLVCRAHFGPCHVLALARTFAPLSSSNCGCRVSVLVQVCLAKIGFAVC